MHCVGGELGEDEVIKVVHHGDVGVEGDRDLGEQLWVERNIKPQLQRRHHAYGVDGYVVDGHRIADVSVDREILRENDT